MSRKYYFINRKVILIFSLLLIINGLLYFIFVKDIDRIIQKLENGEKSLRDEVTRIDTEGSAAAKLESNLKKANEELKYFYINILSTKEDKLSKIMEEIDSLTYKYNLPKSDLNFNYTKLEKEKVIQFDIVFPLKGRYLDIRNFINEIESSSNFLIIDRIELISIDVFMDYINLNVHLQTYFSIPG
jgi:Tfp pilus assembly protein PilO